MAKESKPKRGFPGQHEGEKVELVFHQHPLVMRKALIIGMLLVLLGVMIPYTQVVMLNHTTGNWKPLWFLLIIVVVIWFYAWVGWYYTVYIMTDERLIEIKQRGFFNRKVSEYGLDKIQNINYHIRGFQAVIFQFGDIVAQTFVGDVIMKMIHRPVQIHSRMIEIVRRVDSSTPFKN
ncbi:MAG TPA: PH domain-containing protein [Candidatus Saccharimonadales bacterium]|nr:PH domain-containing protein [Candidatus Saccharimonadales bacterium]